MKNKFKKFEPMTPIAHQRVEELVKRGGIIINERRDHILIQRMESIAKIDQYGRVEWTDKNL